MWIKLGLNIVNEFLVTVIALLTIIVGKCWATKQV